MVSQQHQCATDAVGSGRSMPGLGKAVVQPPGSRCACRAHALVATPGMNGTHHGIRQRNEHSRRVLLQQSRCTAENRRVADGARCQQIEYRRLSTDLADRSIRGRFRGADGFVTLPEQRGDGLQRGTLGQHYCIPPAIPETSTCHGGDRGFSIGVPQDAALAATRSCEGLPRRCAAAATGPPRGRDCVACRLDRASRECVDAKHSRTASVAAPSISPAPSWRPPSSSRAC